MGWPVKDNTESFKKRIFSALNGRDWPYDLENRNQDTIKKFSIVRYVEFSECKNLLQTVWTKVLDSDVVKVLESLEKEGILRRIERNRWKVLQERIIPKTQSILKLPYKEYRACHLRGICPGCGELVEYKNRHARSGTSHTGEQCSLNKIKSVMGM